MAAAARDPSSGGAGKAAAPGSRCRPGPRGSSGSAGRTSGTPRRGAGPRGPGFWTWPSRAPGDGGAVRGAACPAVLRSPWGPLELQPEGTLDPRRLPSSAASPLGSSPRSSVSCSENRACSQGTNAVSRASSSGSRGAHAPRLCLLGGSYQQGKAVLLERPLPPSRSAAGLTWLQLVWVQLPCEPAPRPAPRDAALARAPAVQSAAGELSCAPPRRPRPAPAAGHSRTASPLGRWEGWRPRHVS